MKLTPSLAAIHAANTTATATMADETGKQGPTPSEAIFFFNIVQHMKNKGDIDWDAVAESSGFKNSGVAKVRPPQPKLLNH